MSEPSEDLFRRWTHVDDAGTVQIYRPFDDPMTLGRGLSSIEFRPDGTVIRYAASPTDASRTIEGRWRCPKPGQVYTSGPPDELNLSYHVLSVNARELRMRPYAV